MMRPAGFILMALLVAPAVGAQTIAIVGGKVFPVSTAPIDGATVILVDGRITAVGTDAVVPPGARRVDARGKWVTPGFVHSATVLGILEVDLVGATDDTRAKGERGVSAAFRAWEALNPASALWAPAREDGVTHVAVLPGGGFVGGQAALVETYEGPLAQMIRKAPIGMFVDLVDRESADVRSRGELLLRLRELLEDARIFGERGPAYESNQLRALAVGRLNLEALKPVLAGELPLIVHVDRAADIRALLALAREYRLRTVVLGGAEAWQAADDLAAARVPVLTGGLTDLPGSFDELGATLENAARLRRAGVAVALTTGGENNFKVRTIRQHAGNAVAYGLAWDEALRAVTLTPAEIFGVADRLGSLEVGKAASLFVASGDIMDHRTAVERVFIDGEEQPLDTRHTRLYQQFKGRP
jgi:imidazolonepropionase-like amidohydrolase